MTTHVEESWLSFTEIKDFNEKHWIKIFHQNTIKGGYFEKKEDALFSLKPYMFSLINKINDDIRIDGKYEFLLEYPGKTGYNMWRQTNHPLTEDENNPNGKKAVDGFDSMGSCSWMQGEFGGLVLSSSDATLLDGSPYSGSYFYSIGATEPWAHGALPGYATENFNEVLLWVRINAVDLIKHPIKHYINPKITALILFIT